ncbi:hypothetical protein LTR56_015771 [Elasticomyces elasticus]|nr:hypothetical protein LTR56_015771 [Elasticomyces elasticus]KAK3661982.1 hypothetical protein LTR22_007153 [Elasticomyces elasticus]KAK4933149.1 hypothetical protein LTR49_000633 [Elasticomyces elasticus]KAK5755892.1 hypothetical protein LTS12_014009 [Elasticomyces elasticus]
MVDARQAPATATDTSIFWQQNSAANSANFMQSQIATPPSPILNLLTRPEPTWTYIKQAEQDAGVLPDGKSRPLLVILGLNGTLIHRKNKGSASKARPRLYEFLEYLLHYHKSSARPENVEAMCTQLFTPEQRAQLVAVWARDKLRLTDDQYSQRVQVYKQLSWVWRDDHITDAWAQDNTVLIDDSVDKGASEPYNLIKIDAFEGTPEQLETDVLGQVVGYLEVLKRARDVSACTKRAPYFYKTGHPAFDWLPIMSEMH